MGLMENRILELKANMNDKIGLIKADDVLIVAQKILNAKLTLLFGNGGSHALASHMAADITKVSGGECLALCPADSTPGLTAWSNDSHYDIAIQALISNHRKKGQYCLIGISTSGTSANVVNALMMGSGGKTLLTNSKDHFPYSDNDGVGVVLIPEPDVRIAENLNLIFMHMVVDYIERACK